MTFVVEGNTFDFSVVPEPVSPVENARDIGYSTLKLWTEFQMLRKLVYRSRNQHRAAFSFHRLQEVKRTGERIAGLELWLKANFGETVPFLGYLNALRLQIEKGKQAAEKAFYYYMQYLDQALFPQLALLAVGCTAVIHKELAQWLKYVHLLYNSTTAKMLVKPELKEQIKFHKLPFDLKLIKNGDSGNSRNSGDSGNSSNSGNSIQNSAPNNQVNPPAQVETGAKSTQPQTKTSVKPKKNFVPKKPKTSNSAVKTDEIDDIFNLL